MVCIWSRVMEFGVFVVFAVGLLILYRYGINTFPELMKKTEIPARILHFRELQDVIPVRIPKDFDKKPVLNFYHLISAGVTSLDETDPSYKWLESIIQQNHVDALIFLLQTQKLVEDQIQDTLG